MENLGLVSIITPCYNSADYIAETIESILAQTYPYWELLITDDCSTDNSLDVAKAYADKDERIRLFRLERNSGAGVCRNNSIEKANGRYIAFCDSDDCWNPQKLEKQLAFMRKTDCALSYTSYMVMDEAMNERGIAVCKSKISYASIKRENGIGCLTAVFDVDKLGKQYFPAIRKRQDWGLWILILQKCHFALGIKEPLGYYRVREGSISRNKFDLVKYNVAIYKNVLGYSNFKSILSFFLQNLPIIVMKKLKNRIVSL